MKVDPTPPRDVTIFKKEIKRNKKEIKSETLRAPRVLIFRKFLSYIQKRNNWKNRNKDETFCARWRFTIFHSGYNINLYNLIQSEKRSIAQNDFKKRNNTANAVLSRTSAKNKRNNENSKNGERLEPQRIRRFTTNFFFALKKK